MKKRILSLLLAICMTVSLIPSISAEVVADDTRETLTYLINSDSFAVAYNDLRYVDAHIAYDDGWLATTPNMDTGMNFVTCISWKKQLTKKYDGSGIVTCDPYTVLDLNKTSPYQIENHIHNGPSVGMNMDNYALYATLKSSYYGKANPADRPYLAVRISVPAAGKYRIATWSKYSQIAGYGNTKYGSAMKVYFGKAPADPDSSVTNLKEYVSSNINANLGSYNFIGWHDTSNDGSATPGEYIAFEPKETDSDIIEVPSAGEYYIVFMADSDSLTRNPNKNSDSYQTQWFALSGIKLSPVKDKPEAPVVPEEPSYPEDEAAPTNTDDKYVFNAASHNYYALTNTFFAENGGYSSCITLADTNTKISSRWAVVNQASGSDNKLDINNYHWTVNVPDTATPDYNGTAGTVRTVVFELRTTKEGSFTPTLTFQTENSGAKYDVYLIEKPEIPWQANVYVPYGDAAIRNNVAALPASAKIGNFDAYGSGESKTVTFDKVSVKAKSNYYLIFNLNGANAKWKRDIHSTKSRYFATLKPQSFAFASSAQTPEPIVYEINPSSYNTEVQDKYFKLQASTASVQGDLIDNCELPYVTWRTKLSGVAPLVDLSKTEGYELLGRVSLDNSPAVNAKGYQTQIRIASDAAGNYYENPNYAAHPWTGVRINVPRGGRYKLSIKNAYTFDDPVVKGVVSLGTQKNGAVKGEFDKGAVAKVYFGNNLLSVTNTSSGTVNEEAKIGDLIAVSDVVGFYDVNKLATDENTPYITDVGYIDVPKAGEYYVLFDIDKDSIEKNPKCWYRSSADFQMFLLSGITLTPVAEDEVSNLRVDLTGTNHLITDSSKPSTWSTYGWELVPGKTADVVGRRLGGALPNKLVQIFLQLQNYGGLWKDSPASQATMFTFTKYFPKAGYYSIETLGYKVSIASDAAIYVNGEYVGDYNYYEADASYAIGERKALNTIYIPEGDVEISLRNRVKNHSYGLFYPMWMEFSPSEKPAIEKVEHDLEGRKVVVGTTESVSAKVLMSDGRYQGFGLADNGSADAKNTITVTSLDESIASVSNVTYAVPETESDILIDLSANKVGQTSLKVAVTIDGLETYTETIPVKILPVPEIEKVEFEAEKDELPATRTSKTSYKLISNIGEEWTEETEITYESDDTAVAEVSADGVITGVSEGVAVITIKATSKGKTVTASVTVEVLPEPVLETLVLSSDKVVLLPGDSAQVSVEGSMSDQIAADMSKYTIKYKSSNPAAATVDEATGAITALAAGMTVISVEAKNEDDVKVVGKTNITVYDSYPSFTVDITDAEFQGGTCPAPLKTNGYKIVYEESDTTYWRPWKLEDTGLMVAYIGVNGGAWPATSKISNNAITLLVDVPYENDFNIKLHGGKWYAGGVFSVFIDDQYLGDYNFYDPAIERMTDAGEKSMNTVHLTAGEHKISFRTRIKYRYNSMVTLGTIKFDPVAASGTTYKQMSYEIPSEIAIGEKIEASVFAEMTDGSALHFGIKNDGSADTENSASAVSLNSDLLSVSDFTSYTIGKTGKLPFTLTGVKAGDAEIKLGVNVGGVPAEEIVKVKVVNDPIASVKAGTVAEEVFLGDIAVLEGEVKLASGRILGKDNTNITYKSSDESVATVSGNLLTTVALGKTTITATAVFNGVEKSCDFIVEVLPEGMTDITVTSGGSPRIRLTDDESDKYPLFVNATTNLGNELDLSDAEITAVALTPEIAEMSWECYPVLNGTFDNYIRPVSEGTAKFEVTVKVDGRIRTKVVELPVVKAKTEASLMTEEKRDIVRENISKYSWAKSSAQAYIDRADKYVAHLDEIYALIASQEVPRSFAVGGEGDPAMYYCRYCGENLQLEYGGTPWVHDSINKPWKIQCPDCKNYFPTNDFESFYKLGLNEYGEFIYQDALARHAELFGNPEATPGSREFYGYGKGYLRNELYGNLENVETLNCGQGLRPGESAETWGVDDGYGYVPYDENGEPYKSGTVVERHTYIAEFMHYGVYGQLKANDNGSVYYEAVRNCSYAYFYTGDKKYGRVAAVLIDRLADFYPGFDISVFGDNVWNSDGGSNKGKRLGCIWECSIIDTDTVGYDMVFDLYDDPQVIKMIQEKKAQYGSRYSKQTGAQIRQNIEDNLIRTVLQEVRNRKIFGNFGMSQSSTANAAIILDSFPETAEWIDYLLAPGWVNAVPVIGGGVDEVLIEKICADGHSNEASDYGLLWMSGMRQVADALSEYKKYEAANLNAHPKYQQMYYALIPLYAAKSYSPQIGDGGNTADLSHWLTYGTATTAYKITGDKVFAQLAYMLNGNSTQNLRYGITEKDPERLAKEIQEIVDKYGTVSLDSDIQTGFGYAILRDGHYFDGTVTNETASETTRNVWMYFGSNGGHGHKDSLNLGMTAFGLNFLPELGYPENTGSDPNRVQWVNNTISHNTVVVNEKRQDEEVEVRGKVKHFDDAGQVQVLDVERNEVYPDADIYRRSVVMINIDDANSYYVDLFRVLGGDSHIYSFHAQSNEIAETAGLELIPQVDENGNYKGTYAGIDSEYGNDPKTNPNSWNYETMYPMGYTWLENVDRDENPDEKFEIDFAIKDFTKAIKDSKNLRLRMTMLNGANIRDGATSNVAIMDGYAPRMAQNKNIDKLKYVLIENENKDGALDTVFTTVLEPYKGERTIKSVEELETEIASGKEKKKDASRAVKVTLASGRVDYIFYATNNAVTYKVTDGELELSFRGFVGVYSLSNGNNTYKYVIDGDIIGEAVETKAAIVGTVRNFTKELSAENTIEISTEEAVSDEELASLANRVVIIDNESGMRDGAYKILSAERNGENIVLNTGRVSMIRKYVDMYKPELGYVYTIAAGQEVTIPLSMSDDHAPVFDAVADNLSTSAGSVISVDLNAVSDIEGVDVSYSEESLPRGATIDENTGVLTWKPTASQVGNNHIAVNATDSDGRRSTVHFIIAVYGSTTGAGSQTPSAPSTPSEPSTPSIPSTPSTPGGSGGAGGGGGGGAAPAPSTPSDDKTDVGTDLPGGPSNDDGTTSGDDAKVRFVDLGAHAWAADAINALADEGIIKGTSENTFSPAANITRADFALLLVRAFKLTSENTENFADVAASDYFAAELAIARNTGIVNGIGDNKFAPRNTITRQDMMTIVYRALTALEVELETGDVVYPDFEAVAEYAKDSVKALIASGLVNGKSGKIAPTDYTTRAEVAVLIKRILVYTQR
ncbi:MAG: S-layer homology domain-containing protein [Oscillospiraceae bacterium]|nr:S-layer homology domain-containing protein [Oscillospiraceae bacterium]